EEVYYIAAFTLYKLKLLIGNNRIEQRYSKLRWHIIMAIKYYVCGSTIPQVNSAKIRNACESIEKFVSAGDDDTVKKIKELCAEIVDIDAITRDRLKGRHFGPRCEGEGAQIPGIQVGRVESSGRRR